MKLTKLSLATLTLAVAFTSCNKDIETPSGNANSAVTNVKDMVVPDNFNYNNARNVDYSFSNISQWGKEKLRLDIYDFSPYGGGDVLESKFLEANGTLSGKMTLANTVKTVYAVLNFPDGSSVMTVIEAQGNSFNYDFSAQKSLRKTAPVSTNCSSGCDQTFNNHSSNVSVNSNDAGLVYCFTGNTTGNININKGGVTVRICGTANINQISLNNGSFLEITDGADVTIKNLSVNSNGTLTVYNADLTIENNFSPSGTVTNYGTIEVEKGLNLNSNADLDNYGTVTVEGNMNVSSTLSNYGTLDVDGNVALNGGSSTFNTCKMMVGGKMDFNAPITIEGYIGVDGKLTVNGSGVVTLKDGGMLEGAEATINNSITGTGVATSLMKVSGKTTINGGGSLNGSLEYCDLDGVETNTGAINAPATLACNVYIATSSCNPKGNGSPQIADDDNDGVANDVDLYPNDPTASGAIYYPASNQFATIAFEDLWPYAGDYDFNDLVVGYNYTMVTNANNEVVRVEGKFATKAIGASLSSGFGVQLECTPSVIATVTGNMLTQNIINESSNGTEQGQSKATVIVFDNAFNTIKDFGGTRFVNTRKDEVVKTADTIDVTISFNNAISQSALGAAPFNPFIFIDGERGKEVHLAGHEPTDLADNSYFGIGADDTQVGNGKYYKSEKNHPWAINMEADFDYPVEKEDIVTAYNFFAAWAQSGGAQSTDWCADLSGYRNSAKVY
ncbi:LruC domain-containing protein [Owenweeksia hongkongensis]|uniref:LruC domain-containing protein n=1 Tax=Owenweeksia hongkongensis TaxID=253245 RepID=UPI003A913838